MLSFKNIELTNDVKKANAITHRGCFHADEIFATIVIMYILKTVVLARISLEEVPKKSHSVFQPIIYDIGRGVFDHHQPGGNGMRENGIRYSSFGLIWRSFGTRVLEEGFSCNHKDAILLQEMLDKEFVQGIDAADNGQLQKGTTTVPVMGIPGMISTFMLPNPVNNLDWENECFLQALKFADAIFRNVVLSAIAKLKAKDIVEAAISRSQNEIMVLPSYVPWKDALFTSANPKARNILYVVFPSSRNNGYSIIAVPKRLGSRYSKKPFPYQWGGLTGNDLVKVTKIPSAMFCHNDRFIATAKNLDAALSLARLAIQC